MWLTPGTTRGTEANTFRVLKGLNKIAELWKSVNNKNCILVTECGNKICVDHFIRKSHSLYEDFFLENKLQIRGIGGES